MAFLGGPDTFWVDGFGSAWPRSGTTPPPPGPAITLATGISVSPVRLHAGQTLGDIPDIAQLRSPASYTSTQGNITTVQIRVNGLAGADSRDLAESDVVRLAVQDDAGNERLWMICDAVEYSVRITNGAGNTLEIDRNEIVTSGIYDIDLNVANPPLNATVPLDIADLVAGPVMLGVPSPAGDTAQGAVLSVADGIAATENPSGITARTYRWRRFLTGTQTLAEAEVISGATAATHTIGPADAGHTIVAEQTAVDASGMGTSAMSTTGIEVPGAAGPVTVTFTGAEGTALQSYVPEDGEVFAQAIYSPDPAPMRLQGNAAWPTASGASSAHVQTGRAPAPNARLTARVRMSGAPNNTHSQGITLWDSSSGVRYTFRFNGNNRRWQLYRFGGAGTLLIFAGEPSGSGSVDGTFSDGVVREIVLEINSGTLNARIDGTLVGTRDISGDGFVAGQPGLQSYGATSNGAAIDSYTYEVL